MTKSNTATKAAEQKAKKVLSEKDIPIGKLPPTTKELHDQTERELRQESAKTGAPRAAAIEAAKREASGLAKGLDGRNAPHSSKALQDDRAKARASNKADKKAERAKAKADRKAERASKAAPKADDARKITILKKDFAFGREGSARRASWDACMKAKTVADYAKAGGKLKYLPRWSAADAIKLG